MVAQHEAEHAAPDEEEHEEARHQGERAAEVAEATHAAIVTRGRRRTSSRQGEDEAFPRA